MKTITIQIGNTDDKLTQDEWRNYVLDIEAWIGLNLHYFSVHFFGGSVNWSSRRNVAWVMDARDTSDEVMCDIKKTLKALGELHHQDSIAWTEGETEFI
jgi:hypothetical protein